MAVDYEARAGLVVLFGCLLYVRHAPLAVHVLQNSTSTLPVSPPSVDTADADTNLAITTSGSAFPGVFVATGDIGDPPNSQFPLADTAVFTYGNIHVAGLVQATNDIVLQGTSLWQFWQALRKDIAYACGIECLHGTAAFLSDCHCECEPHWTGPTCALHDCYDHGTYDPTIGVCVCNSNYDTRSFCATHQCPNGSYITAPDCLDPASAYTPACPSRGAFFPGCIACATPDIDTSACPLRNNWGRDLLPNATNGAFGVCGGGYTAVPDDLLISGLDCGALTTEACQDLWDDEAHICCAPGVQCAGGGCGSTDVACCAALQTDSVACMDAGCAWCSASVCAAPDMVDLDADCSVSVTTTVDGNWQTWQYGCSQSGEIGTVCDAASRDAYLAIYAAACGGLDPFDGVFVFTNMTTDCLITARRDINEQTWPRLQPYGGILPGPVRLTTKLLPPQTCTAELDMGEAGPTVMSVPAVWRCAGTTAVARLILVNVQTVHATPWLEAGSPVMIMAEDTAGGIFCLLDGPSNTTTAAQTIGNSAASETAVFIRVRTAPAAAYCGQFRLDFLAVGIRTELCTHGLGDGGNSEPLLAWQARRALDPTKIIPAAWGPVALKLAVTSV
jgi:hypothetical protein